MREALLNAIAAVPHGYVVELGELALSLNIPSRHAGYIISRLSVDEFEFLPWHRVIPSKGDFGPNEGRTEAKLRQIALLESEGAILTDNRHLDFRSVLRWSPDDRFKDAFWADFE